MCLACSLKWDVCFITAQCDNFTDDRAACCKHGCIFLDCLGDSVRGKQGGILI